jgi:hypothetical protein
MTDRTALQRQHRMIARERQAGLYRITVAVPMHRVLLLRELVKKWQDEPIPDDNAGQFSGKVYSPKR